MDQVSPYADAATGTPPEEAEMPLAQSQCTDSMRDTQEMERIQEDEMQEGVLHVTQRDCFTLQGCLEVSARVFL